MTPVRKIQLVAAAVGGLITTTVGALLTFGVVDWSSEQTGAVSLVYASVIGVVIAVAQAFTGDTSDGGGDV